MARCQHSATFNNISVILWRSVLLVEETWVPGQNHRPVAVNWNSLSHIVASSTFVVMTDCIHVCSYQSNYHMITTTTACILQINKTWTLCLISVNTFVDTQETGSLKVVSRKRRCKCTLANGNRKSSIYVHVTKMAALFVAPFQEERHVKIRWIFLFNLIALRNK